MRNVFSRRDFLKASAAAVLAASAAVGETPWKLDKPTGNLSSTDVPLMNTKTVQVSFKAPSDDASYTTFEKGEPLKMRVSFFDQSIVFYLRNGNKTVSIKKS